MFALLHCRLIAWCYLRKYLMRGRHMRQSNGRCTTTRSIGLGIPLISIHTLDLLTSTVIRKHPVKDSLYCAMLDARRMEVYAAIYDAELNPVRKAGADIVTEETYATWLNQGKVCFFGNGAAKCSQVITSPNALFIEDIDP